MRTSLRRKRLVKPAAAPEIVTTPADTTTAAEAAAQAKINARDRVVDVMREFMNEHREVFTQFAELSARAEIAEKEAKEAVLAIETDDTWTYSHTTRGARPSTPIFNIALLPNEVLLTPGIIKTIDHAKLEKLATGSLAAYAKELAAAKGNNTKNPSVSFANKAPTSKVLKKLLSE